LGFVGDGFVTGRVILMSFPLRLGFAFPFAFDGGRFEFKFVALFELPLVFLLDAARLLLELRFAEFELSFAFLFVFLLRFGLFSFAADDALVFRLSAFSSGVGSGVTVVDDSPSFNGRLVSIATVCPALTTSPALGN
jgi:hypothetical protein